MKKSIIFTMAVGISALAANDAMAAIAYTVNFDNITLPKVTLPYTEGGYRLDLLEPVNDPGNKSHIHGHQSAPPNEDNRYIKIGYHFRGAAFDRTDGQAFSLQSWDVLQADIKTFDGTNLDPGVLEIAGYRDGVEVARTQLPDGASGTFEFPEFGRVDRVEFWFPEWCKGCYLENIDPDKFTAYASIDNPHVSIDNVTFAAPQAVPLPGAVWLLGSALLGWPALRRVHGKATCR